jgi:cytokinin dehydrogenase
MDGKLERVRAWATSQDVRTTAPDEFPTGDFRTDPRIDFGRYVRRTPGLMLHPNDATQLAACMRQLGIEGIPFTTRAGAHSSGGQVLIEGGVVIDLRALNRVLADDPELQTVTVEGGARWLDVIEYLAPLGRRPPVLTDNSRSTVGGTLAVGGFGSSSHRHGLQVQQVRALTVITLDGERHVVRPGDDLYAYTLCGRGQLGVIADATLTTVSRPWTLRGRMLGWRSIVNFMDSATRVLEHGYFDFFRAMMMWEPGLPVMAVSGDLGETLTPIEEVRPDDATPLEEVDLLGPAREDHFDKWKFTSPALELLLPLPDGLMTFRRIVDRIIEAGLHVYMPRGSSLMVLRRPQGLPLAPFPDSDLALLIALRLEISPEDAPSILPALRDIGNEAMKDGARCYLISLELETADFLERQFGDALPAFRALKDRYDPKRLLNPWHL